MNDVKLKRAGQIARARCHLLKLTLNLNYHIMMLLIGRTLDRNQVIMTVSS